MITGQYGVRPLGATGPDSADGFISILGILPAARNRVIAAFDLVPNTADPKGARSATNVSNWQVTPIDPAVIVDGKAIIPPGKIRPTLAMALARAEVDAADPTQVHVWTDRPMEAGVDYLWSAIGPIDGAPDCEQLIGQTQWTVKAPKPPPTPTVNPAAVREIVDVHDGLVIGQEIASVWHYTAGGDLDVQSELDALRKRIHRMISTAQGEFAYDPDFGAYLPLQSLEKPTTLQRTAASLVTQIRADELVARAYVQSRVRPLVGGGVVAVFFITIETGNGETATLELKIPVK